MRHNCSSNLEDRMNTGLSLYKRELAEVIVDTNNNLTSVKDANNNTTSYKYDDKGRVYQVTSPDTGTITYQYDPAGNMISKTDAKGVTISYVYDAVNRLTKIDFPTDTDIIYAYDSCPNGKGRLCSMTDQSGTTALEYTAKGQVRKETKTIDSIQYVMQYSYDQNGNLKTMTYPSGRVITYNYTNSKVSSVLNNAANLATNINYKPFGGMSSLTYGNGLTGSISYDNQYRITSITAGTVMNLSYPTYDANGNIIAINNTLDPTKNKSFTYDALDRLSTASASGLWGSLAWTYDGVGNRLTENSTVYSYVPGTNKLSGVGGSTYSFDSDGNTTSDGTRGYTYNQNQRLIQAVNGATTANYTYNGNGQRVKKVVNGVTTIFHYSVAGALIAESDSTGSITAEYVYLNRQPLAKIEGSNVYFYHDDALSTPQKMTDGSGAVVWSADYKPFGEATVTVSTITNNLRFPGQYFDAETGLNYSYRRDYNSIIGKYLQADPIGLNGGINKYLYVFNNPLRYQDPSGLYCVSSAYDLSWWMKDGGPTLQSKGSWNLINTDLSGPEDQVGIPGLGGALITLTNAFTERLTCWWSRTLNYIQKYKKLVVTVTVCVECGHTTVDARTDWLTKEETYTDKERTSTAQMFMAGYVISEEDTCKSTPNLQPAN
jgi:RHS repeat-associated protein